MAPIPLLFAVFALVCFILAAIPLSAPHWNRLVAIGLAFLAALYVLAYTGLIPLR
jgi:hypothetical protein